MSTAHERIAVLGAGTMGTGIAALAVGHGVSVTLVEPDTRQRERALERVRTHLRFAQLSGRIPGDETAPVQVTADLQEAVGCSAVVEAVTEDAGLKARVWKQVSGIVAPGTLLVSNTSAVPIDEQAASVERSEDMVGIHFMNPPYMITTTEVVRGPRTSETALVAARELLSVLDRTAIVVGDAPGFVINRILQWMINEAARITEEGIATPENVDALFQGCLGHTTGPLATADLIGLDNVVDSLRVLRERIGDERYEPCAALLAKVEAGHLGRKTGRGFFEYGGKP
ncbi:3-hydroxyacyl-CoA dehydrogenase family protein [Nocardiopsis terrae]